MSDLVLFAVNIVVDHHDHTERHTRNDAGNAFWNKIGWTRKTDVNYYEFVLNEKNITQFIGEEDEDS